jgi:hypothetical protein
VLPEAPEARSDAAQGSEMPHVISTQLPPFSSTTLYNINNGEDVSYCSLGETFHETRLSRYISTAFVCGSFLGSGAPTPFRIEVTQQPTPSFVCESGRAGRNIPICQLKSDLKSRRSTSVFYNYEGTRSRKNLALVEHWRSEYATFAWALEIPPILLCCWSNH